MIFFLVWLRVYSREVLRESFDFPKTFTMIGILGILGILVAGCPSIVGLVPLTSSLPPVQHTEPKKQTPTIPSLPSLPCGWAFGLDLFPPSSPTQRAKPKNSSHAPPQPLTCSSLRLTAARGWGYAPTHNPPDEQVLYMG